MIPPKNVKIIEFPTSTMWFDEDGVLYSVPKSGAQHVQTREESQKQMDEFRKITGGKKTCMILETDSSAPPPKKEDRDWIAQELDSVTKAMGIISTSPLGRMLANLFFGFKPPAYPVKFFSNQVEAKEWIKQYL
ncbi:MAG TPA: hypothetical protein VN026_03875 [Bacteroidia bacterium]|jgi:hypothetical protein|nr:hypothetical protein [Bacteroidia bacterium]